MWTMEILEVPKWNLKTENSNDLWVYLYFLKTPLHIDFLKIFTITIVIKWKTHYYPASWEITCGAVCPCAITCLQEVRERRAAGASLCTFHGFVSAECLFFASAGKIFFSSPTMMQQDKYPWQSQILAVI